MMQKSPKKFGFLLLPGFPMACLTSAIEPLRAANEIHGAEVFTWSLISETGHPVTSSAQVVFQPDTDMFSPNGYDILFVLSGPQGVFENPQGAQARLRHLMRHGVSLGAVSGGVFPLARSGILQGHVTSVHWCYKAAFEGEFPNLETSDDVIVMDRRIYTASGAAAAFDVMLKLIEDEMGDDIMTEVACWFQHPLVRSEGVRQKVPSFRDDTTADALPRIVTKSIELFSENFEFPLSTREVSEQVGVSPRQLERAFKAAVDMSPGKYYRILRMRAARQLVIYSNDSFTEIARSVGYSGSSTLAKHYREAFGLSPQEERRHVNRFRAVDNRPLPSI